MVEILKKQWFVVLIALIFICFSFYYIYDTNKGKLPGKSENGKDVIAEVNKKNITADDIYNNLNESMSGSIAYLYFERLVADQAIKTSDAMEKDATAQAESYKQQVTQQYGELEGANFLKEGLKSVGYGEDELDQYFLHFIKVEKLQNNYIEKHLKELFPPVYEAKHSRVVSHILIKMADANNPTTEELQKVAAVQKALSEKQDFAKIAKKYSDDTGSKAKGGNLGYADSDTNFVAPFKEKAFAMSQGEVSDWVKVSDASYNGWHIIKCDTTDMNSLMKDKNAKTGLYKAISDANPQLKSQIIWNTSKDLKVEFKDKKLKQALMDNMGIKE
ncbi:MAG: peptidylprolyl isomerase [Erysipelotrichaceae bacterium]